VTTIALGRRASAIDREKLLPLLAARQERAGADARQRDAALADICQIVLCASEFVYID
jgi:hypothetical protein